MSDKPNPDIIPVLDLGPIDEDQQVVTAMIIPLEMDDSLRTVEYARTEMVKLIAAHRAAAARQTIEWAIRHLEKRENWDGEGVVILYEALAAHDQALADRKGIVFSINDFRFFAKINRLRSALADSEARSERRRKIIRDNHYHGGLCVGCMVREWEPCRSHCRIHAEIADTGPAKEEV